VFGEKELGFKLGLIEPEHSCPVLDMFEEIRFNKLSAAKKILTRCKYLNNPCVLVEE
jgi:hypothetical protein